MIQEFGISITAVGGDQYLVRTEKVVKGVQLAEERVHWPLAEWLEQTKALMHDPLLGLLQGQQNRAITTRTGARTGRDGTNGNTPDSTTLVQLGQTLHDALFQGQLHDSWVTAQGVAQNRQDLLRLRLGIKDARLQQLPWEALHAGTRPLATGTEVIFSRYILNRRQEHSVPQAKADGSTQTLRILMVIAAPNDQERLELKKEVHQLQAELHPDAIDTSDTLVDVQLKILEQPGRAELTQALERGNYQVLHYAGHSNLGNAGGDLYLVSRQTGLTERLSGEDLAGLLVNNGIKLAVFNSCRGGYSASSEQGWQERNLAQALVNRGMPAVIAMAERIPDHVAITFTQLLYRNLKKGQSIDLSLNRTRQGLISAYGSHQFYWALPTLYMHPLFDGYLVKTSGSLENVSVLDSANDPFGDLLFSEPGLAEIDLPSRQRPPVGMLSNARSKSSKSSEPESVNDRDLVKNNDVWGTDAVVNNVSEPSSPVDVEGELSVSDNVESSQGASPKGVYGESAVLPVLSPSKKSASAADEVPELVGERLTRSHTVHTKLLTGPGIASVALIALMGIMTVFWLNRGRQPVRSAPATSTEILDSVGLLGQIEIALDRGDLDGVATAARSLIDQGDFEEVVTALKSADTTQQGDVVVAFFKGRAQWALLKQGDINYSAADAMRSWTTALESESDWMEIAMALGFSHYATGRKQLALEAWERSIALAERQPEADVAYFSEQTYEDYVLNARAGLAMSALALSKIETNPAEKQALRDRATEAYLEVMKAAPVEFSENSLGGNWLWLEDAIIDWEATKQALSQSVETE